MRSLPPVQIGRIGKMGIHQQRFSVTAMSPSLWLDAADKLSIEENAGNVCRWKDKSRNGNHVTQEIASYQPSTSVNTINDVNIISFDGENDHLYTMSPFIYDAGSATIFTVHKAPPQSNKWPLAETNTTNNNSLYALFVSQSLASTLNKFFIRSDSGSTLVSSSSEISMPYYTDSPVIATIVDTGSELTAYTNGVAGSATPLSYTRFSTLTPNRFCIGALLRASIDYATQIDIGEILVFSRVLTSRERNKVGRYLAKKWGVSWTEV